ncbi:MAG: hypothetical protein [Namikivirus ozawa]|uniref:Uncharacterized protein n=1 Tax=Bacteriophage sp. TaxID=38018 RepID=A0ABY5TSZ5_9VIRU|nr:MAG: hypothetical protein [Bacteriophage sp.]
MTTPILNIDTRKSFRQLTIKIDGTTYTMRPLGSKDMLTIIDNAEALDKLSTGKMTKDTLKTAEEIIFPLVTNLMSPNNAFHEWAQQTKQRSDLAYLQAMTALCKLMAENLTLDIKG